MIPHHSFRSSGPSAVRIVLICNRPISQIPECICDISHNAPFCNRNVHMSAHFCYKMVHCGVWHRYILGFVGWVYYFHCSMWDIITHPCRNFNHGLDQTPLRLEQISLHIFNYIIVPAYQNFMVNENFRAFHVR